MIVEVFKTYEHDDVEEPVQKGKEKDVDNSVSACSYVDLDGAHRGDGKCTRNAHGYGNYEFPGLPLSVTIDFCSVGHVRGSDRGLVGGVSGAAREAELRSCQLFAVGFKWVR